jgi:Lrp/AsnC family transcriptional regulator for asnA, asnC and gidA
MTTRIEGIEWQILEILRQDGRTSNREIARRLGVSEGTIRSHIRRMEEQKLMRISAVTSLRAMGMRSAAHVGIFVEPDCAREVAEALTRIPEVTFVAITFGQYDLIAVLLVETREQLLNLLSEQIATIRGVRRTETAEVLQAVKHEYTQVVLR